MTALKVYTKFFLFLVVSFLITLTQGPVILFTKGPLSFVLPIFCHLGMRKVAQIKLDIHGKPVHGRQVIYACNHISYLDIPVIGSLVRGAFIAKSEVADWGLFGFLARLGQTVFISRAREDAEKVKSQIVTMIDQKKSLILFAEGTSTDGTSVLPFKSSLFGLLLERPDNILVQPVTIDLLSVDGKTLPPGPSPLRDRYAWHRDMTIEMTDHLKAFFAGSGARLRVTFHEPLKASCFTDRKVLALACQEAVAKGLSVPYTPPLRERMAAQ